MKLSSIALAPMPSLLVAGSDAVKAQGLRRTRSLEDYSCMLYHTAQYMAGKLGRFRNIVTIPHHNKKQCESLLREQLDL